MLSSGVRQSSVRSRSRTATTVEISCGPAPGEGLADDDAASEAAVSDGLADGLGDGVPEMAVAGPSTYTRTRRPPASVATAGTESGPPARAICHATSPVATSIPYTASWPTVIATFPSTTAAESDAPAGAGSVHRTRNGGLGPPGAYPWCPGPPWYCDQVSPSCAPAIPPSCGATTSTIALADASRARIDRRSDEMRNR